MTTALIADDEPLLRERLRAHLAQLWPELVVVADARNGIEAVELFEVHQPQIVFLDVHMPGLSGIDAARALGRRAHLVFITAYEHYALQAFDEGAVDYLVKPIDPVRLGDTVQRLRQRLTQPALHADALDDLLDRMAQQLKQARPARAWLQWIKASVGTSVRLIPVNQVVFIRAEGNYTRVISEDGEALIKKSIRELADELAPDHFVQTHRAVIVNLHHVRQVVRGLNETAAIHLQGRDELLPVSRSYLHQFRQM